MLRALAAGADELIKMEDERFESHLLNSFATARIMAETIKQIGNYDLILAGRQASDWNSGYMGIALAKELNIPCVTFAQKVDVHSNELIVNRAVDNGYEIIKSKLPAVVMVTNELGELRYPAMKERREAKNKPVHSLSGKEMPLNLISNGKLILKQLYYPELKITDCKIIDGDSPMQAGVNLARTLLDNNILQARR